MPRPKRYPNLVYVRLSDETQKELIKQAKVMGLAPAAFARAIIEHSLGGKPIKEGSDGTIQQKN